MEELTLNAAILYKQFQQHDEEIGRKNKHQQPNSRLFFRPPKVLRTIEAESRLYSQGQSDTCVTLLSHQHHVMC